MRQIWTRLLFATTLVSAALWGADPFLGTWKLNLVKSQYGTVPAPKSNTMICVAEKGGGSKCTSDGVNAQGQPTHTEYTVKTDGKDYPVTGSLTADAVAVKQIDSHTREYTGKKTGQVVFTVRVVASKDGKTLTGTWNGKNPEGKPVTWTTVSDKQ